MVSSKVTSSYNATAPVLVIAPHLTYPARDGADILINRHWGELSKFVSKVDIVAAHSIVQYEGGRIVREISFSNNSRPKWRAALRTVLFRSVYTKEKFLTKSFVDASRPLLADASYQTIIFSFLASASLTKHVKRENVTQYVLTHNDDIAIYRNMRNSSRNPIQILTAIVSERWVRRFGRAIKDRVRFIHVSEDDADGWSNTIGKHGYTVGKVGCDLPEIALVEKPPMQARAPRIIFVGSLGVKMNSDAIRHFAEKFLPTINERTGKVQVKVVGSNPTSEVEKLCQKYGFDLFANVSEDELAAHFAWADFSILPFPYSTGTKLKLLDSIARGIPIMATEAIGHFEGIGRVTACLVSDNPSEWAEHVKGWKVTDIPGEVREKLIKVASGWTWEALAKRFFTSELVSCSETGPKS